MRTVEEIAVLINQSSMTETERESWLKVLPDMPQDLLLELADALEREVEKVDALKKKYAKKFRQLNDAISLEKAKQDLT